MVQTTKEFLVKEGGDVKAKVARFLLQQHITPSTTTGKCPAELLMGRRLRTALDKIYPSLTEEMTERQEDKYWREEKGPQRHFVVGDTVHYRVYNAQESWAPAIITKVHGPRSYEVRNEEGSLVHRHLDQIRSRLDADLDSCQETRVESKSAPPAENPSGSDVRGDAD